MGTCMQRQRIRQIERNLSNYQPPRESQQSTLAFPERLTVQEGLIDATDLDTGRSTSTKRDKTRLPLCLANLTNYSSATIRNAGDSVWKTARKPMITLFIDKTQVRIPIFDKERALADYERCQHNMYRCLHLAYLKYPNITCVKLLEALRYPSDEQMVFCQSEEIFTLLDDIEDFKELSFSRIPETCYQQQLSQRDFLVVWRMLHFWKIVQLYPQLVIFFRADTEAEGSCSYEEFNGQWREAYKVDLDSEVFIKGQIVTLQSMVSVGERLNGFIEGIRQYGA